MHPVIDRDLERLVIQPGQIAENLDEIESDFGAEPQQTLELRIELRLAPDKLDLPATESVRLGHQVLIVFGSEDVAIARVRTRLRVAVHALRIAAIGQLEPEEIQDAIDILRRGRRCFPDYLRAMHESASLMLVGRQSAGSVV